MSSVVLMDSNVFISYKFNQDVNHQRAVDLLEELEQFPLLTQEAAYEVVAITRSKINSLIEIIFFDTSVLDEKTSTKKKLSELESLFERLEEEANLGTFLRVIREFCITELEKGRSTLDHLGEWASDLVNKTIRDILEFCRVTTFDKLPRRNTDEDFEFVEECANTLDVESGTKDRDTQIFWDALAHSRFNEDVVLITFDKKFAKKATKYLAELAENGITESNTLRIVDINDDEIPE